jgi:ribosomal protein S18 acetylase RimI-like enzyme
VFTTSDAELTTMEIRQANVDDAPGIKEVARESLLATYEFLDEETIREAVEGWYGDLDDLREHLVDGQEEFLVAAAGIEEDSRDVIGFSQSAVLDEDDTSVGEVRWLHVHPGHRGEGTAESLLTHTEELLRGHGADRLRGVVLAENRDGNRFWEDHDFERAGIQEVNIGGTVYAENKYETGARGDGPRLRAGEATTPDGRTVYVAFEEEQTGSSAPFYPVYTNPDHDDLYGWYCGGCDGFEVAMDAMERLECHDCGNTRKPSRWDSAYL